MQHIVRSVFVTAALTAALSGCTGNWPHPSILAKGSSDMEAVKVVANANEMTRVTVDVMLPYLSPDATDLTLHLKGAVSDTDITVPCAELDHGRYPVNIPVDTFDITADMPENPDGSTYEEMELQTVDVADLIEDNADPSILVAAAFVPASN